MSKLDDELRARFREQTIPVKTSGVLDMVRARTRRRRRARRAQTAGLVVSVLAATAFGGIVLTRAFRPGEATTSGASIRLTGNGPVYYVRGPSLLRAPGGGPAAIYRMSADGSAEERVTGSLEAPASLAWSPDGKRLAFTQSGGEFSPANLYVMNADGSEREQITHYSISGTHATTPAWSPDGTTVVFASDVAREGDYELFTVRPDGSGTTQVTHCAENCQDSVGAIEPSWSPDGSSIVFGRDHDLWTMRTDGSDARRLTRNQSGPCCSSAVSPAWSPDGSEILFVLDHDPTYSLWEVHPDGGGLRRLYACAAPECLSVLYPTWSPDGREIAFTLVSPGPEVPRHVAIVNADGSDLRVLTDAPPDACCPAWQPVIGDSTATPT
ncbi:MAG: hypothetical protein ACJ77A_18920 [Actinomycetota bacterium]